MPWMLPAAIIGSSLFSAESSADAAETSARASGDASAASVGEQRRQYDLTRADYEPFLTAGKGAVNRLAEGLRPGGEFRGDFTAEDFLANRDPGYGFRLSEGIKARDRSAAARGGLLSGATLKGAEEYGQGLASQEYQNAFNRYQTNRANQLNPLQSLAGQGQTTATSLGSAGANMASNIGNAYMTSAANTGNAAMAGAGIRSSAYGGAANMLGRMYGPQLAGGYGNYGYTPRSGGGMDSTYAPTGFNDLPVYG